MDNRLGRNINNNTSNDKKQMFISSKKFYLGFINKNNNNNSSKYSNSKKDIYSKKNLISMNTDNNTIKKQNNNDYQSPKISFQDNLKASNNNKLFKSNYSEININNKKNQNKTNKDSLQLKKENKNYMEQNKNKIINYKSQGETIIKGISISNNNSIYNTDNNKYYFINNSNSNNYNEKDNIIKTDALSKNKIDMNKNLNNRINNFVGYKKEELTEVNDKNNNQINRGYKNKIENNNRTINELYIDKKNINLYNNLNKMISSVNIESENNRINKKLKKNVSDGYEIFNNLNLPNNNEEYEKYENQKDIINKNKNKIFQNYNYKVVVEGNKISPIKNLNINKVKTNTYGTLSNYKDKANYSINTNMEKASSPSSINKKNYQAKNELIKKNLNININEKENNIMSTPNKKHHNYINLGNNSSYSKSISASSSQKKLNNRENEFINKNKGRILINNNEINRLNQISLKTEESLTKIRFINNQNFNKNTKYTNDGKQIIKKDTEKTRPLFISPDKNNYYIEYKISSSAKIQKKSIKDSNKSKNKEYISQDKQLTKNEDNSLINNSNDIKTAYPIKTSIFNGEKNNNFENTKYIYYNNYEISDNINTFKTYKIRINKNISNISKSENDIESFNNSERQIEKGNKKNGIEGKVKNEIKSSYSPNININYNINNENNMDLVDNNVININMNNKYLNKNRKNIKISNSPINNVINNNINNNIIFNKNTNLYVMNNNTTNKNNNDYMENSLDSFQKKDFVSNFVSNNKNQIYKKRNTNESKTFNNFDENKKYNNYPIIKSVNNNINDNIYDFDTPIQNNNTKTYINKKYINNASTFDNINNLENDINIRIKTPIARNNNLLSERNTKEKEVNYKENEHLNNFINYQKRNIIIKNNELIGLRKKNIGSPKIYKKKFDLKNRQFILQKENKINQLTNNSYHNKENNISADEYNINNKFPSKQIVFLKDIQNIYNAQKRAKNKMEFDKVNNFELKGNKKNNNIKIPVAIVENKIDASEDKKINAQSKTKKNIDNNINNINKKKVNKDKIILDFHNKNKQSKSNNNKKLKNYAPLIKPKNKCSFKHKYYFYHIKKNLLKECFYTKLYIFKGNKKNRTNKDNNKMNPNDSIKTSNNNIPNDESQEMTFTQKIPALIDNNINNLINNQLFLNENSFKNNNKIQNINNATSDLKVKEDVKKENNIRNIDNNALEKIKENIGKLNKFNNLKNLEKEELEMTFGIEEINNNQSKIINNNNNSQMDININDFSTINNNTNHSIVLNEYLNNNTNRLNQEKENNKIYYFDEEENQNEDVQVLSEDEEIKKEEGNYNMDDNNSIVKRNEAKMIQTTEGKEILVDINPLIPDKINKGLKLLEKIQVKRNSKYEFQKSSKSLSNSENKNFIMINNNFDDDKSINNNEKKSNIFENELLDEDIYLKKNNTFKPKKSKKLIDNMTKDKKCEILNDILTGLFNKKEKEKNLNLQYNNITIKEYTSNDNKKEEENNIFNLKRENNNRNINNSKIAKYIKIFNLNPIKNLEDILYKNSIDKMIDFIHDIDIEEEIKNKKQNVLTYNKKLKKEDKENILIQNNVLKSSNSNLNINNHKKNENEIKIIENKNKVLYLNTPKFYNGLKRCSKITNKKIFSYEDILQFNKLNYLSSKENFLSKEVKQHCNDLLNYTDIEYIKSNLPNKYNSRKNNSIERWSRKDVSKEIKEAEEYIKKMNIEMSKDNFKYEIIEILNTITVDNYEEILNKLSIFIYQIKNENYSNNINEIRPEILLENQYRFAEIIIDKAIMEKGYIKLYAKLCYDLYIILDKILDNYIDTNIQNQLFNGENLKSLLIGECKQRFNDYQYNDDIENENDSDLIFLIKKKFLGNINFIVELIDVKLFSQKIGFDFLEALYRNYKEKNDKNKYLNLEGAIDLLNKFGKIVFERKNERYLQNLENYLNDNIIPLSQIIDKKDKDNEISDVPGYLKYKIINLIEKQKSNWEESLYEKSIIAKGKNQKELIINRQNDIYNKDKINNKIEEENKNNKFKESKYINNNICYSDNKDEKFRKMMKRKNEKRRNNSMKMHINNIIFYSNNNLNEKNQIKNSEEEEDSIVKLIKKDLNEYIAYINNRNSNNKSFSLINYFYDEYNWEIIENLLFKKNIELSELIHYFIEICIDLINTKDKISYANEYIKNLINYSYQNIKKEEIKIIKNKMIELFKNIDNIILENNNMFEILGNLLFSLIDRKLFHINDLNIFMNKEKQTIINISKIIKNAIISSGEDKLKYYKMFEKLETFKNNDIFENYIKIPLINEKIF